MAVRQVRVGDDPILRQRTQEIDPKELASGRFRQLTLDLIETMRASDGVGIAAPQVGESVRLFIADSPEGPVALANPVIIRRSWKTVKGEEGCLSLPGRFGVVKRAKTIRVKALTATGGEIEFTAKDFFARVIQHETDHLDGILFIDRIEEQKR